MPGNDVIMMPLPKTMQRQWENADFYGTKQYIYHLKSPKDLKKMLKEFEGYWQIKLQTLEPYGMNHLDESYNAEYHDKARSSYLSS